MTGLMDYHWGLTQILLKIVIDIRFSGFFEEFKGGITEF